MTNDAANNNLPYAQRQVESLLRASVHQFHSFLTVSFAMLYRMSADWREMYLLEGKDFLSDTYATTTTWLDRYIPDYDKRVVQMAIDEAIQSKTMFELEHQVVRADGSVGWVLSRAIPFFDAQGDITEWFGASSDITDRKARDLAIAKETAERAWAAAERAKVEKALQENEALLSGQKKAFEAAMDGQPLASSLDALIHTVCEQTQDDSRAAFFVMPVAGEGLYLVAGMSEAYARDVNGFKVGPESLSCGLSMHTGEPVITPDIDLDPQWEPFRKLAHDHGIRGCWSFPVRTAGGPVLGTFAIYFRQPRTPVPRELELAGVVSNTAAIIISRHMELTERAQAEAALRNSEQQLKALLKVREEFLGIASHELKTPVTSISVLGEILEEQLATQAGEVAAAEVSLASKLNAQVLRLTNLINDLLDTSKIENGQIVYHMENFDLNALITERVDEIQRTVRQRKINLNFIDDCLVSGDRERIAQVVVNLVSNAIKYSPLTSEITIASHRVDDTVQVFVIDQGIGIPAASLDKVFDQFYRVGGQVTRNYPGMGLGLYIASQIVHNHGGTISVTSQEGKGTTFSFTLPLHPIQGQ